MRRALDSAVALADRNGGFTISAEAWADRIGAYVDTIRKGIRKAEAAGVLERVPFFGAGWQLANEYRLAVVPAAHPGRPASAPETSHHRGRSIGLPANPGPVGGNGSAAASGEALNGSPSIEDPETRGHIQRAVTPNPGEPYTSPGFAPTPPSEVAAAWTVLAWDEQQRQADELVDIWARDLKRKLDATEQQQPVVVVRQSFDSPAGWQTTPPRSPMRTSIPGRVLSFEEKLRTLLERIERDRPGGVRRRGDVADYRCPLPGHAHGDRRPSARLARGHTGGIVGMCLGCHPDGGYLPALLAHYGLREMFSAPDYFHIDEAALSARRRRRTGRTHR